MVLVCAEGSAGVLVCCGSAVVLICAGVSAMAFVDDV